MNVRIANRIYIEDPTREIIDWAKENLELPNPDYAKKQRMGFWVGLTPKTLRLFEWNGNTLILPFGVCREIMPMVRGALLTTEFKQDSVIDYGEQLPLYDYQKVAVEKMAAAKYGILKATTGAGKTQCGLGVVKALKRRALWLCHTQDLLKQSRDRALQYMDESLTGTITEGKVNVGVGITFATVQTMANLELTQYRDYWDVVICDECHRVGSSATTFTRYEKVLNHLAARHKFGLTATPQRSDGLIKATFSLIGNVAYEIPEEAVADRVTGFKVCPVETDAEITDECLNTDGTINYVKLIGHLEADAVRNRLIVDTIVKSREHSCLILSERLEQLVSIMMELPEEMREKAAFINGKMTSKRDRALREQWLEEMRTGEKKYLFASYNLCKEGLDIPRLDRLFLATPVKYSAIVIQAVGRVRRVAEGKDTPVVFDFVDRKIGFCENAYKVRCRSYRKLGGKILTPMEVEDV